MNEGDRAVMRLLALVDPGVGFVQDEDQLNSLLQRLGHFQDAPKRILLKFLRKLITKCESMLLNENATESLYNFYNQVESSYGPDKKEYSFHFPFPERWDALFAIRVDAEAGNTIVKDGSTGFRVWEASKCLLTYFIRNPHILLGQTVLELGSGTGFCGLGVSVVCKCEKVILTDVHLNILSYLRDSASRTRQPIEVAELDWFSLSIPPELDCCDVLIGADLVYDLALVPGLVSILKKLLRNCEKRAYFACALRSSEKFGVFCEYLQEAQLIFKSLAEVNFGEYVQESLKYGNEVESRVVIIEIRSLSL